MPRDLDCAAISVMLLPMIHGQLTPTLNDRIHDHLKNCPTCQQEFDELQGLKRQMTTLADQLPPAPDRLWSKLQLATGPESESATEPRSEPLALLSSCLGLLTAVGIPQWATQPVARSISLATEVRDELLTARIPDLSRLRLAGSD